MRHFGTILGMVMTLTLAMAPVAMATAPEVVFDGTVTNGSPGDPVEYPVFSDSCGFEVMGYESVSMRMTVFYDQGGEVDHTTIHVHGSARYFTDTAETFEKAAVNVTIGADGSVREAGNRWNTHAGAGGVLVQQSGLAVFDSGGLVALNGPHEYLAAEMGDDSGLDDFCAALSS